MLPCGAFGTARNGLQLTLASSAIRSVILAANCSFHASGRCEVPSVAQRLFLGHQVGSRGRRYTITNVVKVRYGSKSARLASREDVGVQETFMAIFTLVEKSNSFFARIAGHIQAARGVPGQNGVYHYCGAEWASWRDKKE